MYDKELKIIYDPKADSHYVIMGRKHSIILQHGILEDLSRTPLEGFRGKLNAVNSDADYILRRESLSYERLWWAIVQARFFELDQELRECRKTL